MDIVKLQSMPNYSKSVGQKGIYTYTIHKMNNNRAEFLDVPASLELVITSDAQFLCY